VTSVTMNLLGSGYTSAPTVVFSGGGIQPNPGDISSTAGIALTAKNSILSDQANLLGVNSVASAPNVVPNAAPVQGQYCNGARIPPEQCSTQSQGANNNGMCLGYFTPAGQSETFGVSPVFVFNGIKASATVDEGNNWINMTFGPLSLSRPSVAGSPIDPRAVSAEPIVAGATVGAASGAYTIMEGSPAIDQGANTGGNLPNHDFFGQPRPQGGGYDIGAMELTPLPVDLNVLKTANVTTVAQGGTVTYTIVANNPSTIAVIGAKVVDNLPTGMTATWTCSPSTGSVCPTTIAAGNLGATVTLAAGGSVTFVGTATIGANATAGTLNNTATVVTPPGYTEANAADNTSSVGVTVTAPPPHLTSITPASV